MRSLLRFFKVASCRDTRRASFEPLESRQFLSASLGGGAVTQPLIVPGQTATFDTVYVTNTHDSGAGSLRRAIREADMLPDSTIDFAIPAHFAKQGVFTIEPSRALPPLTQSTTIDGASQAVYTGQTNGGRPVICIDGARSPFADGLTLKGPDESVKDLVIDHFTHGVGIHIDWSLADGDSVYSCMIGTNPSGTKAAANSFGITVQLAQNAVIGAAGQGNIISGNTTAAILMQLSGGTVIQGNWIGLDVTGEKAIGNGVGVQIDNDSFATSVIGGNPLGPKENVIAGNTVGIETHNPPSNDTVPSGITSGNLFGTTADGTGSLPNTGGNVENSLANLV